MAGNVKGITVEIGGDTTKLGKALENSEKQSRNLQKELKQVNTALKFNPSNIELLTQKQKLLTSQIEATKEKLETLKEAEAQVEAQFNAGEIGEEQFRAFQREIIETESKLKTYQAQLEETGKKASALEELTTAISDQETEVDSLKNEWKNAVLTYGEGSDEANALAEEIDKLSTELKENKEKMSALDQAADELDNSLEEVETSTESAGEGFTVFKGILADLASQVIQKAVSGMIDLAKETLNVGMAFEESMSNNAALFGATGEELDKLSETAQHYGETTQFSASEAAEALGYMALAGWDANKATEELGGVLDLAASSGMGLAEASDMVTDYLSAFSNTTMTATEFADKLAYAQANSNTTARQLGEAYKNSAANLNAAGQDVETVTSLLAAMANQGLKGAESGTALSAMMRDLTAKMEDGEVQIGETLVAVQDANGNYRDLTDILKDVEKATDGMGSAEKAAALSTTFTADSIKGLNLILNDGVDKAADFEEGLRDCDGSAADMAETMNDNVAGSLKLLKSNIESKMIKVFDRAKGSIKGSVESMSSALDSLDWDKIGDAVGKFAEKIANLFNYLVENAETVQKTLIAVGTALTTVFAVNKIAGFISSLQTLGSSLVAMATKIGLVTTATEGATTATTLLAAAQAALPWVALAAGAALVVGALVKWNKEQKEQIENLYGLNEEEKELISNINAEATAIEDATKARKEANAAIDAEAAQNSKLWDELQDIVDANGKIKKGYEDRAAVITGLLSEALGTEIEIVDGQIQKYGELKDTIEDVIRTKRAEALLEASKADYAEAISKSAEAYSTYSKALENANSTQAQLTEAEERAAAIREEMTNGLPKSASEMNALNQEYLNATSTVETLREKYDDQSEALEKAESNYFNYASTIQNYEGLMAAIANGDVEELSQAMDRLSNNFLTAENATKEMLENQLADFQEQYKYMKEAVEAGMPGVTQANVDAMADLVNQAEGELDKLAPKAKKSGKKAGADHAAGVKETAGANKKAGETVSKETDTGLNTANTKKSGKKAGTEYAKGVKETAGESKKGAEAVAKDSDKGLGSADTKGTGKKKGTEYAEGVKSTTGQASAAGKSLGDSTKKGEGSVNQTATGRQAGTQYTSGVRSQNGQANSAGKGLANNAKSGAGSVSAYPSGSNFGQGFVNGIGSFFSSAFNKAKELAKKALAGLKQGQKEGSPSKLTYQSGIYFDEGYINAIRDKTKDAVKAAQEMAKKTVAALNGEPDPEFNFDDPNFNGATFNRQLESTFSGGPFNQDLTEILDKLDTVVNTIQEYSGKAIVLDTGVLVGETLNKIDNGLANTYALKARGV